MILTNFVMKRCVVDDRGGGIYLDTGSTLLMSFGHIVDTIARGSGGGMYASRGSKVHGDHILLHNNKATENGGALSATDSSIVFSDVNMTSNQVSRSKGGAFYLDRDTVAIMKRLRVVGNKAFIAGGGGCIKSRASLTLEHAVIKKNGALVYGGGLHFQDTSKGYLNHTAVTDGNAHDGAGISITDSAECNIENSDLSRNIAVKNADRLTLGGAGRSAGSPR